eukprot:SAG31_NODE_168_length_21484_cov_21.524994_16_plen_109_part_00
MFLQDNECPVAWTLEGSNDAGFSTADVVDTVEIILSGSFTGTDFTPYEFASLGTEQLVITVDNVDRSVSMSANMPTAEEVRDAINSVLLPDAAASVAPAGLVKIVSGN